MNTASHFFEEHTKTALTRRAVESILFDKFDVDELTISYQH